MMQTPRGQTTSQSGRIEALHARRESLKEKIREARKHPATSAEIIQRLKRENIRLKDEIEAEMGRA